jgi:hypothetical protein
MLCCECECECECDVNGVVLRTRLEDIFFREEGARTEGEREVNEMRGRASKDSGAALYFNLLQHWFPLDIEFLYLFNEERGLKKTHWNLLN